MAGMSGDDVYAAWDGTVLYDGGYDCGCGVLAFGLLLGYSRLAVWLVERVNYRYISLVTLGILVARTNFMTGWGGLAIMLIATPIGWLPVLWGSRRLNCLGVLLVPITLNLAGLGPNVAGWLGILS